MFNPRPFLIVCFLLLLLFQAPACQGPGDGDGQLAVVFPAETSELFGGQPLRARFTLVDRHGQPVEGATVHVELRAPDGQVFASPSCVDMGRGYYYMADRVRLPLRGSEGTWHMVARATWGSDGSAQARAERTFEGQPSLSETYQTKYGFWIETPYLFYEHESMLFNVHFEDWPYEDGGGYVLVENTSRSQENTGVGLDVHWWNASFPADEAAAIARAQELAVVYYEDPKTLAMNLTAERATFQDRPVWHLTGQWRDPYIPLANTPVEWMIFRCPDSPWLWALVIYTTKPRYMDELRALRGTFRCPAPKSDTE